MYRLALRSSALATAFALSACPPQAPTKPVPPASVLPIIGVGITVTPPRAVHVHAGDGECDTAAETGVGYCVPVHVPLSGTIDVSMDTPPGFDPVDTQAITVEAGANPEVRFALHAVSVGAAQHGPLHVCGLDFCDEDGQPWLFAGYATYTLISEVAHGHDINPLFEEATRYGANTIVTLGMDLGPFAHDHDFAVDPRNPQWASWLATIFDTAAAHQLRVALGVFQQAQALSDAERRQAFATAANVARGRWNVLLRCGNEDDVNGWRHDSPDCARPPDMQGVLLSTGSRGINNPPTPPNWDWAEWEPPREPRAKTFSDAGGAGWYMLDGYPDFPAVHLPLVVIEPPFFHDSPRDQWGDARWTNPGDALRLGLNIGANFAGGTFGSSQSLESHPNGPGAAECARQFFRGLRAAFVR